MTDDAVLEITVPYQDRPLEPPDPARIRQLKRHLIDALRDLRVAKRPDKLIQTPTPDPPEDIATLLRAGCAACQGHCCLGGGEHAYIDERTMARVRRDQPTLDAGAVIRTYIQHIAPLSYAGSCLFHGPAGCTLPRSLRAELCSSYYCDALKKLRQSGPNVTIRAIPPTYRRPPAVPDH